MTEIVVSLPKPHEAQKKILKQALRFNVLANGRRFGKTTLSLRLIKPAIANKWKIGFWNATYKDLNEVWMELKHRLQPIIKSKDEQLKKIYLVTGGQIDMWSMDDPDSGRGFKYHRAIIDEFAKAKHGQYAWEKTIRPTLTDYSGDAWFLSTPKGINNYFYELFKNEEKHGNWKSWQYPTASNPYISRDELSEIQQQVDPLTYRQEYLAEFISMANRPFMYCFEERHISKEAVYKENKTIYLSFDFNVNPMSCVLVQAGTKLDGSPYIHFIDEITLFNSDIYEVCRTINSKYPNAHFMVTGDRSGMNHTGLNKNINYYFVIKQELKLKDAQFKIPVNPFYEENIVLCNSLLANHPEIIFNSDTCKETIYDMRFVEWDGQKPIKDDRTKRSERADHFDAVRYYFNTFHRDFIKRK